PVAGTPGSPARGRSSGLVPRSVSRMRMGAMVTKRPSALPLSLGRNQPSTANVTSASTVDDTLTAPSVPTGPITKPALPSPWASPRADPPAGAPPGPGPPFGKTVTWPAPVLPVTVTFSATAATPAAGTPACPRTPTAVEPAAPTWMAVRGVTGAATTRLAPPG